MCVLIYNVIHCSLSFIILRSRSRGRNKLPTFSVIVRSKNSTSFGKGKNGTRQTDFWFEPFVRNTQQKGRLLEVHPSLFQRILFGKSMITFGSNPEEVTIRVLFLLI